MSFLGRSGSSSERCCSRKPLWHGQHSAQTVAFRITRQTWSIIKIQAHHVRLLIASSTLLVNTEPSSVSSPASPPKNNALSQPKRRVCWARRISGILNATVPPPAFVCPTLEALQGWTHMASDLSGEAPLQQFREVVATPSATCKHPWPWLCYPSKKAARLICHGLHCQ